jgi:hypothetical protein
MTEKLVTADAHEGPVYVAAERALYFTAQRAGWRVDIMRLSLADGRISTVLADAAVANGMTLGRDGRLVVCEQQPAAISFIDPATGARETVVDAFRGLPLNSPNDGVVKSDGSIWFTDPSYAHVPGLGPEPRLGDDRPRGPGRTRRPRRARQQQHAQDAGDPEIARRAAPLRLALHPDQQLIAEPRRALVRRTDDQKLRRGAHRSVGALNADIRAWIDTWNDNPSPSSGPRPPTRSSTRSPATASESMTNDTSDRPRACRLSPSSRGQPPG